MNHIIIPPELSLEIQNTKQMEGHLDIFIQSAQNQATCPQCQTKSETVHGWYKRHPQDLPCFDDTVQLHIQVKRFQCLNKKCQQRTFAQRFPQWLAYKARRTERLQRHHLAVAYHVSGEAGRRLLACLKMPTSGDTLIRDIRRQPEGGATQARVIGIDDWAKRKGFSYGTIIVDLEKQQPIVNSGSKMVLAAF